MSFLDAALTAIFWLSVAGVAQTYLGVPLLAWMMSRWWRRDEDYLFDAAGDDELPAAAVIIPAYNEEACIRARIENLLEQDYPADKLRIVVGSDCSTDRTHEIVKAIGDPRVELRVMPDRRGKLGVLDTIAPEAPGEVVVVTDANIHFDRAALRYMLTPFTNPRVGGVGANLIMRPAVKASVTDQEILYRKFETWLKSVTGRKGLLLSVNGNGYAFRRKLFQPFGLHPVHDDIILPLEAQAQGARFVFAPKALVNEDVSLRARQEYRRRVRMTGYSLHSLARGLRLAKKIGAAPWFLFFSYKALRWLSPYLLGTGLAALAGLAARGVSPVYNILAIAATIYVAAAAAGWLTRSWGKPLPVISSAYYFALMNVAAWEGFFKLARVKRHWEPRGGAV